MNKLFWPVLFTCFFTKISLATDLLDVYRQALESDPVFKQAYSQYMSSAEAIPQARAALLPQVNLGASSSRNLEKVSVGGNHLNTTYDSNQWQVNASQALFNYQAWQQVAQAKASVKAAQATFNAAGQDLILRTAKAYFSALLADDTLKFAEAKKRANRKQFMEASERYKVGVDTMTSVYEAKAGFDRSVAEVIAAKNNEINQNANLRKLTNQVYAHLASLKNSQIPLIQPKPAKANDWIRLSLQQNYQLFASKYAMEAARENIKVQSAANWPVLALQGNSSQTLNKGNAPSVFVPNRQTTSNVGLALNFPAFQGGLIRSKTKQADYDFQTASQQFIQTYRDVEVNTTIAFNTITDGLSKVQADRQTVSSQKQSLDSTAAQFEVGTRTMVDVINAQQRLFEAQEQLAADQYNLINSLLYLKYLAGTLNVRDLAEINSWLNTRPNQPAS